MAAGTLETRPLTLYLSIASKSWSVSIHTSVIRGRYVLPKEVLFIGPFCDIETYYRIHRHDACCRCC